MAAALVCTMLCSLIARPAYADPGEGVPDTGSRPIASGSLIMPGQAGAATAPPPGGSTATQRGPFAAQLAALESTVNDLGQKRLQASIDLESAQTAQSDAETKLIAATAKVTELRDKADTAAADAYKRAAGLGPLDGYADDLHQFGMLAPGLGDQPGGQAAARDLLRAEEDVTAATEEAQLARDAVQAARGIWAPIDAQYTTKNAEYLNLRAQNEAEVLRIEAAEDAYEQSLAPPNLASSPVVDNMQANPKALQALNFALSKIGSWYVWGDEGPNTFDCSGLAYWSYAQVGVHVPRVANDMYHGTPAIQASKNSLGDQLLPGDLVYFATDRGDWRSIYHMGIYVGGGMMVNAPTTGQKVKIAPVKWSRFFGATRIFGAVPAPGATPTTAPPTTAPPTTAPPTFGVPTTSPTIVSPPPTTASPTTAPPTTAPPTTEPTTQPPSSSQAPASQEPEPTKAPTTPPATTAAASKPAVVTSSSSGASTTAQTSSSASGN